MASTHPIPTPSQSKQKLRRPSLARYARLARIARKAKQAKQAKQAKPHRRPRKTHRPWIWGDVSIRFRRLHPHCEVCGKPAEHTHHRVPIEQGGSLLDESNLQSLCSHCHEQIHTHMPRPSFAHGTDRPITMGSLGRDLDTRLRQIARITRAPVEARRAIYEGVREAIQEIMPQGERDGHALSPYMARQIIEKAIKRLDELDALPEDANAGPFLLALIHLSRTYDARRAGDDLWYDDRDVACSFEQISSRASNEWLAQYSNDVPTLRYALAVAHCHISKFIEKREGAVSHEAVRCELARRGLPHSPEYVAQIFKILTNLNLIICVDARYWSGRCRRWAICGPALPFIERYRESHPAQQHAKLMEKMAQMNAQAMANLQDTIERLERTFGDHRPAQEYYSIPSPSDLILLQSLPPVWQEQANLALSHMATRRI